jgi:hypothetical protein
MSFGGVTVHTSPIASRRWAPVVFVVAAALAIGGIAGAGSLADDDDANSSGAGGRLAVQR